MMLDSYNLMLCNLLLKGPVGFLEKFAAAYQAVQDGQTEEDEALQNCNYAISHVESLEKEAESRNSAGTFSL